MNVNSLGIIILVVIGHFPLISFPQSSPLPADTLDSQMSKSHAGYQFWEKTSIAVELESPENNVLRITMTHELSDKEEGWGFRINFCEVIDFSRSNNPEFSMNVIILAGTYIYGSTLRDFSMIAPAFILFMPNSDITFRDGKWLYYAGSRIDWFPGRKDLYGRFGIGADYEISSNFLIGINFNGYDYIHDNHPNFLSRLDKTRAFIPHLKLTYHF